MDGCDAMKSDPISKDQLTDELSALLGAATLNLDPTISVDLGMAQRLVDILRQSASGEPSEEQVRAVKEALQNCGGLLDTGGPFGSAGIKVSQGAWFVLQQAIAALQADGIQSGQAVNPTMLNLDAMIAQTTLYLSENGWSYKDYDKQAEAEQSLRQVFKTFSRFISRSIHVPTDDAIRSTVKLNSTPDRHCTVFKGTEITGYTLTDEGIAELRKLFGGAPVAMTEEMVDLVWRLITPYIQMGDVDKPMIKDALTAALSLRGVPEGWNFDMSDVPRGVDLLVGSWKDGKWYQSVYSFESDHWREDWDTIADEPVAWRHLPAAPQPGGA
jgi:hypothetical protein